MRGESPPLLIAAAHAGAPDRTGILGLEARDKP